MYPMKKYLPLILLVALSTGSWVLELHHYLNFETLKSNQMAIDSFVSLNPWGSALIYGLLYVLVVSLSIPGAAFMSITTGFLFGQWWGMLIVVISATFGSCFLFLSAKQASPQVLTQRAGSWGDKMQKGFQDNAFSYLLTLRLIPLFPFVAVNLVAALLQIPFRTFFWGTFLGIMPGSFVFVSLGVALRDVIQRPDFKNYLVVSPKVWIALVGLGILSLLPALYKRFR